MVGTLALAAGRRVPLRSADERDRRRREIASGDVYTQRLTFPEGLTIAEMAKVFESRGFGSAREFTKAASDASLVKDLDPKARDLEGYLFRKPIPCRDVPMRRAWWR